MTLHRQATKVRAMRDLGSRRSAALRAVPLFGVTSLCAAAAIAGALSVAGCQSPSAIYPAADNEADLTCYWSADDFAKQPPVKAALADGILTARECTDAVMPLVRQANDEALQKARRTAVADARRGNA